jgi:UDP-glucose 4-epimerase
MNQLRQKSNHAILVTGGAGFIGTHLCARLISQGHSVVALDLRAPKAPVHGVEYVRGDVRDRSLLDRCVEGADVVYHLAATVSVPLCQENPVESYSNNVLATVGVLDSICARARTERNRPVPFVFASSAALYGSRGDDRRALTETDTAPVFSSFYAAQKHACEKAIEVYHSTNGVPAVVFRFFNVFGPGQDPSSPYSGVITLFMKYAKEGRPLPLNGGGTQTRDFISVYDIADAAVSVLGLDPAVWDATPVNLGSGETITVRELAEQVSALHGKRSALVDAPSREGDVLHSLADISKARTRFGFYPSRNLRSGLSEI